MLKKTLTAVLAGIGLIPSIASAQEEAPAQEELPVAQQSSVRDLAPLDIPARKVEPMEYRMMGGADIALNHRFNPANLALANVGVEFRLAGLEYSSTLRDPFDVYDTMRDFVDIADSSASIGSANIEEYRSLLDRVRPYDHLDLSGYSRADLVQIQFGVQGGVLPSSWAIRDDQWVFMIGAYAEGETVIRSDFQRFNLEGILDALGGQEVNLDTVVDVYNQGGFDGLLEGIDTSALPQTLDPQTLFPDGLPNGLPFPSSGQGPPAVQAPGKGDSQDTAQGVQGPAPPASRRVTPLQIFARADTGMYLGVGTRLTLARWRGNRQAYLAFGVKGRGFERWAIPAFQISVPERLALGAQFATPGGLRVVHGEGFGVDAYVTLDVNDPVFGSRVALELRDVANRTFFRNGQTMRDPTTVGLGVYARPLRWLGHDQLGFAFDVERLGRDETYQFGAFYTIDDRLLSFLPEGFSLTPKAGFVRDERDAFSGPRDVVTAGALLDLRYVELGGLYRRDLTRDLDEYGASLSIKLSF